jgi:hypothetical protein
MSRYRYGEDAKLLTATLAQALGCVAQRAAALGEATLCAEVRHLPMLHAPAG